MSDVDVRRLTPREREVFDLMGRGLTNIDIARLLGISDNTVRTYARRIFGRLGVSNRTEAVGAARSALEDQRSLRLAKALASRVRGALELTVAMGMADLLPRGVVATLEQEVHGSLEGLTEQDREPRARLLISLALVRLGASDPRGAARSLREAEETIRPLASRELALEVEEMRWWLVQAPDQLRERQAAVHRRRGLGPADAAGRPPDRWHFLDRVELGDLLWVDAELPLLDDLDSERPHDAPDAWVWHTMRATLCGRFLDAQRCIEVTGRLESSSLRLARSTQQSALQLLRGPLDSLIGASELTTQAFSSLSSAHLWLALCYAEAGQLERARSELTAGLQGKLGDIPFDQGWIWTHALAAEVVGATEDPDDAGWLYEKLRPYEDRLVLQAWFSVCRGSVSRLLGLLATTQGAFDRAIAHLERSVAVHERLGAAPFVACSKRDLARALQRRGRPLDAARARDLARTAEHSALKLGMPCLVRQARDLLASLA